MLYRLVMLNNIDNTIHKRVVNDIVNEVKTDWFSNKDIYTIYLNNLTDSEFESTKNIWSNEYKEKLLEVEYEVIDTEELMYANNFNSGIWNNPIMLDKPIMFGVEPLDINTQYKVKFKLHAKSRVYLQRILNTLKSTMISSGVNKLDVKTNYYYTIPKELLGLLKNIYKLKTGNDTGYYSYIENITIKPIDYLNSKSGDYQIPIYREEQEVIGFVDTETYDINRIERSENGWSLEFELTIEANIPRMLKVQYPLLVHNQMLDKIYYPPQDKWILVDPRGLLSAIDQYFMLNNINRTLTNNVHRSIISYPTFDQIEYIVPTKPGMIRLLSMLVVIDKDNPDIIFSINDLRSILYNKFIPDYLEKTVNDPFTPYKDIFHIELFENRVIVDKDLYLDDNKIIRAKKELDLTKEYHVVISLVYDRAYLNDVKIDNVILELLEQNDLKTVVSNFLVTLSDSKQNQAMY